MEENTPSANKNEDEFDEDNPSSYNKIPIRIKSGLIKEKEIEVHTSGETKNIPFEDIEYICLGMIEEQLPSSEPPKSGMRNMVRGLLFGKDNSKEKKIQPMSRHMELLDIYVKGQEAPYRIDSSAVNYKGFLPEISYRSSDNFKLLLKTICLKSTNSKFNKSLLSFVARNKERGTLFSSTHEFSFTSWKERRNAENQLSWKEIDFESIPSSQILAIHEVETEQE